MNKINGVHHIALKPNDEIFAKTVDFYKNTLGCRVVRLMGEGENPNCMLSCGDNTVMEILRGNYDGSENCGSLSHVAFAVDEVDSFIETIRAQGYKITMEPKNVGINPDYQVRVAFFIGPVGEEINCCVTM